ncbi:hypothetical protein [Helicobacter sp.]|uniref:hypothetical protein n=1 Tax=Helicobacter sp. TaxID=218 RepID=UPI00258D5DBE|nr:hypothetical protein [Helicobacter sp.]MCI7765071.1 hypothetical protein [Helicobacter sp.]
MADRVDFIENLGDDVKKSFLRLYLKGAIGSRDIAEKLLDKPSSKFTIFEMIRNQLNLKDTSEVECLKEHYEIIMRKYEIVNKEEDKKFEEMKKFALWYEKARINTDERKCHYCEITEENLKKLFDNKVIQSKKPSFNSTLQIERLNPNKGYVEDNCVLACCICNNAKSDMINAENFKEYFAKRIECFYNSLLSGEISNSFS